MINSRGIRLIEYVSMCGKKRNGYNKSVGKLAGKLQFRIPRNAWKDNIKMDFNENVN
jgi:hypothetical protein